MNQRPAIETTCGACQTRTLSGVDGYARYGVVVDRWPVSRDVELLCVLANREVYQSDRDRRLYRRTARASVYAASDLDLHPAHVCGQTLPIRPSAPTRVAADACPF